MDFKIQLHCVARPTVRVTRLGWEGRFANETGFRRSQKKLQKRGAYPKSGARIVGWLSRTRDSLPEEDSIANLTTLLHEALALTTDKNHDLPTRWIFKDSFHQATTIDQEKCADLKKLALPKNDFAHETDWNHEKPCESKTWLTGDKQTKWLVTEPYRTKLVWRRRNLGFGLYTICATRADEPKSDWVFNGEAHAAHVAGCAGYVEASRRKRKRLLTQNADG